MDVLKTEFENYADRILYGRTVRFSEKNSVAHGSCPRKLKIIPVWYAKAI